MTKQQGGGFVIRDSHKKEKVTIQEEKRRQRLRKREKKTETERARWIAKHYLRISHIIIIGPDVTPYYFACLLSKLSLPLPLPLLPYNTIFQNGTVSLKTFGMYDIHFPRLAYRSDFVTTA